MAKEQKTFVAGRMNKSIDERLLPEGEYVDAQNIRLGSTELSEIGSVENTKGNVKLTSLEYKNVALSSSAVCVGAFDDSAEETMYWFVHDPASPVANVSVVDMIVSFNTNTQQLTYHVITAANTTGPTTSLLNFSPTYLVNAVNKIDDLLFFTDDYNAPRKINVTRGYTEPDVSHVNQITELDISVIKPQPINSPIIELENNSEKSNYIKDTFICFAYRYKYKDGEYSATSQFSQPAFSPSVFYMSDSNIENNGMENQFNTVKVTYNTGVENVIGVDLLYKEADSNVIYIAKKIHKQELSIPNNIEESIRFSNSDIYSILSEGEILRLYDNVPLLSKAQSIMGNRLMYGNYLEGRDVLNSNGNSVDFNYEVDFISQQNNFEVINYESSDTTSYDYNFTGTSLARIKSSLILETSGKPTYYYSPDVTLYISVEFKSEGVDDANGLPTGETYAYFGFNASQQPNERYFTTTFSFTPSQIYQTAYQAYNTPEFKDRTGESGTYQTDPSLWGEDDTTTGLFNYLTPRFISTVPSIVPSRTPVRSGRDSVSPQNDPVKLEVLPNGNIQIVPNVIEYIDPNDTSRPPVFQFFTINKATVRWARTQGQKSLHSNRDYQVGILYEDAEGRYSSAFESTDNTIHISSQYSDDINSIKATIPSDMRPPEWAARYKFLAKQSKTDYETILGTRAYIDEDTGRYWILLEGEQGNKVSIGQELIVKKDSNGPTFTTVTTTVLDVKSAATGDIAANSPSGVYASLSPDGWLIDQGNLTTLTAGQLQSPTNPAIVDFPQDLYYPLWTDQSPTPPSANDNWRIPAGSIVNINFAFIRRGDSSTCGDEICFFNEQYVTNQTYNDLREFWVLHPVDLSNVDCSETTDASGPNTTVFDAAEVTTNNFLFQNTNIEGVNQIQFFRATNGRLYLGFITGSSRCGFSLPFVTCKIEIISSNGILVFETPPSISANNLYYENEQSFPIVNGFHTSGNISDDQNQTALQDGIVNLTFFNCFTFFNGVESYKIKDSITGKKFGLGQRVTASLEQDYRKIRRSASITYSGIYNEQNNINTTNEFNLGLSNYKDCEISYGPIQVIHGRKTDLLTLQEDKISYITIGKSLLTTAGGGEGVLTSVPNILGTQVARIEEYGISDNPESFCNYGADIYFTDAKRSAVIQLKGGSSAESLSVISNVGMRSWFRDLFQISFGYQKLGGYDPYMDEYVLSPNTRLLPVESVVYDCGGGSRVFTGLLSATQFTVNAGLLYGDVTISVVATNAVNVTVSYNGADTSQAGTGTFSFTFDKNVPSVTTFQITITPTDPNGSSSTEISFGCPVADTINIVPVVITSPVDQGKTIHNSYGYTDSSVAPAYLSPFQGGEIQFITPAQQTYISANLVSQFEPVYTGQQGSGSIPIDNSTVSMVSSKFLSDTFNFIDSVHKFRYLRVNDDPVTGGIPYENNATDIPALLAASVSAPISGAAPIFTGNFTMPAGATNDYLYLIWDYSEQEELKLCYSTDINEACCECFSAPDCVPFLGFYSASDSATACLGVPVTTFYTSVITTGGVSSTIPITGTTVFPETGCSSDPNRRFLQAGFIHFIDGGVDKWVQIDSNNIVIASGNC